MKNLAKPEIQAGSLVEIEMHGDEHLQGKLKVWKQSYQWPMEVSCRLPDHVVLKDRTGKIVHFGSNADPSLSIGHVQLHKR
ncbi:MAG: hypothetical protein AAB392_02910 [Patescibacteria group bacterium]